jgi:ATP phosphoribosyltransferase
MDSSEQRIKIAVQKTGRLTDHSLDLLERCGLKFTKSKDQLFCYGENMPVDLLLIRDDDIPGLVGDDVCDLGIVGLNIVEEKRQELQHEGRDAMFKQVFELDFGHCRLSLAAPEGTPYKGPESLNNQKIATSYVGILRNYLKNNDVTAEIEYFRRSRNRPETRQSTVHVRPGFYRLDARCKRACRIGCIA